MRRVIIDWRSLVKREFITYKEDLRRAWRPVRQSKVDSGIESRVRLVSRSRKIVSKATGRHNHKVDVRHRYRHL